MDIKVPHILIIIPAYNESENIKRVVDNLINDYPQYDYVVVNDGSNDDTAKICRDNGYNLIDMPINVGLAGAVQTGLKYASRKGYNAALQFDGDGQHNPVYIEDLFNEMNKTNTDIVIGSRFKDKKRNTSLRMLGNTVIEIAIKLTTGQRISDPTSGMRLYHKKLIDEFAHNMNYGPEPDTISYLLCNGAKVSEVQVEMSERIAGESYLNLTRSIFYMIKMLVSITVVQKFRKRVVNV